MKLIVAFAAVVLVSVASYSDPILTFEGQMVRVGAAGNQTSGLALQLIKGRPLELDFATNGLDKSNFHEGDRLRVTGEFRPVKGSNVGQRVVFIVKEARKISIPLQSK